MNATAALSHHTEAVLALCLGRGFVLQTRQEAEGWREACDGLPLSHMGRGPDEDPAFFAAAYAAGRVARNMLALMEERKLGPVVGLGTSGTFGGDAALAREVVSAGGRVRQPPRRHVADVRGGGGVSRRRVRGPP